MKFNIELLLIFTVVIDLSPEEPNVNVPDDTVKDVVVVVPVWLIVDVPDDVKDVNVNAFADVKVNPPEPPSNVIVVIELAFVIVSVTKNEALFFICALPVEANVE